ncbi:MAG: glycosyltransferase family 2 protein [Cyclobacteriaceae bacterium]|nr:glycosyltransferase family 2 protein [Cyclobacteriaceae bacterium]
MRRVKLFDKVREYPEVSLFESSLLESSPFISVVIPTLNRYAYLDRVLSDLENQDYKYFEVIVVDQTVPFNDSIYMNRRLDLKVIRQSEKALWKARNEAILRASGSFIALYDDDSIIEPDWLTNHLRCVDYFRADISAGVSISRIGAKVPDHYSFFRWSDQFDTGNALLRREVFVKIGLFDRQFEKQRMGDGEFGLRAYLSGFRSISNPLAKRVHLKVESGGLRQMGSWDGYRPVSFFSVRPIPSVLYLTRKYFGCKQSVLNLLIKIPASVLPLQFKNRPFLLLIASIASVVISPVLLVQVMMSWRRSTQMLKRAALIDKINN